MKYTTLSKILKVKSILFSLLAMMVVAIFMTSCEQETIITDEIQDVELNSIDNAPENSTQEEVDFIDENDYSQLKVNNGVLEFGSIDYYESFLDNSENPKTDFLVEHIGNLDFKSFSKSIQDRSQDLFEDEFITSIINENQIVKIGKWFIKLNIETKKVYASSEESNNAHELVLREDVKNSQVYTFNMDDEVLVYLGDEELLNEKGWGCNDRKAKKKECITSNKYITTINGLPVYMNMKVRYRKFGVYFVLKAYGTHTNAFNDVLNYWFQLENCSYAQRCGSSISNYSHPWRNQTSASGSGASSALVRIFKFYGGSKQLKNYNYRVRFRCENSYSPTATQAYITTFTSYAHISDY